MKKLLLALGSIAVIASPVAAVVSCGDKAKNSNDGLGVNHSNVTEETSMYIMGKSLSDLTSAVDVYMKDKTQANVDAVFALFITKQQSQ